MGVILCEEIRQMLKKMEFDLSTGQDMVIVGLCLQTKFSEPLVYEQL